MYESSSILEEDKKVLDLLDEKIVSLILERKFLPLSEAQRAAIPLILAGRNVLVVSPTGTGKTEAAIIPIFNKLINSKEKNQMGFKVIYITPLRALNRDLLDRLTWWASKLDIKIAVRHGDTSKRERSLQSMYPPDLLVTTPETFQILLIGKKLSSYLRYVKWVIVDELHELAQDKRGSQLVLGLERLRLFTVSEPQIVGLSATVGDAKLLSKFLVGVGRSCEVVDVSPEKWIAIDIKLPKPTEYEIKEAKEKLEHPDVLARINTIFEVLKNEKSTLIFTNTRATAEALANKLTLYGGNVATAIHHGSLGTILRTTAEQWLKSGLVKGVVATSSLELGIDVGNVSFVVQYGSPRQATHLIQRVGRSGHSIQGKSRGLIIAIDEEDAIESLILRKRALERKLEDVVIIEKPLDVLIHQIIGLLIIKHSLSLNEILDLVRKSYPYKDLSMEELESLLSFFSSKYPFLITFDKEKREVRKSRSSLNLYKFYYDHISTIPEVKQYKVVNSTSNEVVGTLDEEFVAEKGMPGVKFIMGGRVWVFEKAEEDSVFVSSSDDPLGAVPFWVGEEIPVVFSTARDVGKFRRKVFEMFKNGLSFNEVVNILSNELSVSKELLSEAIRPIYDSFRKNFPLATDNGIVIENWNGMTIIHACNGNQVNSALAKLVASLISDREAALVSNSDPYRVILNVDLDPRVVLDILKSVDDSNLVTLLLKGIENVGLFKRRVVHVSRRFGIVEKNVSLTSPEINNLVNLLKGTPVFEEAKNELFTLDYDLKNLKLFLKELREEKLSVEFIENRSEPSPFTYLALYSVERKSDIFPPEKIDKIILKYALARLKNSILGLVCLDCFSFLGLVKTSSLSFPLRCPFCNSEYIGVVKSEEEFNWIKYHKDSKKAKRSIERIKRTALLLYRYKNLAALALSSNVSLNNIEKLLPECKSEDELVARIVELERRKSFVM